MNIFETVRRNVTDENYLRLIQILSKTYVRIRIFQAFAPLSWNWITSVWLWYNDYFLRYQLLKWSSSSILIFKISQFVEEYSPKVSCFECWDFCRYWHKRKERSLQYSILEDVWYWFAKIQSSFFCIFCVIFYLTVVFSRPATARRNYASNVADISGNREIIDAELLNL